MTPLFPDLSTCPFEDFPEIVEKALSLVREDRERSRTQDVIEATRLETEHQWPQWLIRKKAQDALEAASFQALFAVHPHLDEIFELQQNDNGWRFSHAWRESGLQHFDFLKRIIADTTRSLEERKLAIRNLMETREPEAFRFAQRISEVEPQFDFDVYLEYVGYHKRDGIFKPLYVPQPHYIIFPQAYQQQMKRTMGTLTHPTYNLPVWDAVPQHFGGTTNAQCPVCDGTLHHLITLNPIPETLSIRDLSSLTLAVCLSCVGWNWETYEYLYYQHDEAGHPRSVGYDGDHIDPEFPSEPLQEIDVLLADGGTRWRWRDSGNYGSNSNRVGGFPDWMQSADYPPCIRCKQPMRFILQLGSGLLSQDGNKTAWAGYGIGYGFWCDDCHISSYHTQTD